MKRVAILLSGRGSNFRSLSDAIEAGKIPAEIGLVFSNRPEAPGLQLARERGYRVASRPRKGSQEREDFDRLVVAELEKAEIDIVCLAGYMRLLSPFFVQRFPRRILNIHPSLLPSFPGLRAQEQALDWGVQVTGCSVHFVDEKLDHGPILLQHPVPVLADDTVETLSERILVHEHEIYPRALRIVCEGSFRILGRRVVFDGADSQT